MRLARDHVRRRRPGRPFDLAVDRECAGALQALASDRHAVAHGRAVIADVVEILGDGIDMDVAGPQTFAMGHAGRHEARMQTPGIAAGAVMARDRGVEFEAHRVLRGGGSGQWRGKQRGRSDDEVAAGQHGVRQLPLKNMRNSGVAGQVAPTHPLWTSLKCPLPAHKSVRNSRPWRENRAICALSGVRQADRDAPSRRVPPARTCP
jgi:hypothetical protein